MGALAGEMVQVEATSAEAAADDEDLTELAGRVLVLERMAVQAHERAQALNKQGKFEGELWPPHPVPSPRPTVRFWGHA